MCLCVPTLNGLRAPSSDGARNRAGPDPCDIPDGFLHLPISKYGEGQQQQQQQQRQKHTEKAKAPIQLKMSDRDISSIRLRVYKGRPPHSCTHTVNRAEDRKAKLESAHRTFNKLPYLGSHNNNNNSHNCCCNSGFQVLSDDLSMSRSIFPAVIVFFFLLLSFPCCSEARGGGRGNRGRHGSGVIEAKGDQVHAP